MTLFYISGKITPGTVTATSLAEMQDAQNDDTIVAEQVQAIVTGETLSEGLAKFVGLFPAVTNWRVDQIPTFQVAILEAKYASFLNRALNDTEVAEACAVSAEQAWDAEAYAQQKQQQQDAAAMLTALMASGELPPGFNPDDPSSADLDSTDEDSTN